MKHDFPIGRTTAALALCALLTSCALLGKKPPELHTYTLDGAAPQSAYRPPTSPGRVLLLEVPHAAAGYDSTRMVYVRQALTQEVFSQSVWADTPARMLAPLLLGHLQHSGQFRAVLLAPTAGRTDLRLDTTVLRLQQNFLQVPSTVHFQVLATLMDSANNTVVASHTIEVVQTARSEDAAGGAAAAQGAVQLGLQQVVVFLQAALADLPAQPALPVLPTLPPN